MKIKFDDIGEQSRAKQLFHDKFQEAFLDIYDWAMVNHKPGSRFKKACIVRLNYLIACLTFDGHVPADWDTFIETGESSRCIDEDVLYDLPCSFTVSDIDWSCIDDLNRGNREVYEKSANTKYLDSLKRYKSKNIKIEEDTEIDQCEEDCAEKTPKQDLFIVTTKKYPRVGNLSKDRFPLRESLPLVPLRQVDISATTDVSVMQDSDFIKLYPNQFIRTRSECMYVQRDNMTFDENFGSLVPVQGFTDSQVRDSLIRYPHIFKLKRIMPDGSMESFYKHIEVDGELLEVAKVWQYLPEAKIIDFDSINDVSVQREFLKEYVIRRYLLERDVAGIQHKYEIFGDLPAYITLFMPWSMYKDEGFSNPVSLAKSCVSARVSYLRSRNPRLLQDECTVDDCPFSPYCGSTICDRSCPKWAQISYLLMRNRLDLSSMPFSMKDSALSRYTSIYDSGQGVTNVLLTSDTIKTADVMSYICVCNRWNHSAMRVKAYHLVFSEYIDGLRASFGNNLPDEVAYAQMWSKSCDDLVISGFDYMNLKDYACQVLLQLLQGREREGKTTFVIIPDLNTLVGSGDMFKLMKTKLGSSSRSSRMITMNKGLM